jgi:low temperature requirement protein LtrA
MAEARASGRTSSDPPAPPEPRLVMERRGFGCRTDLQRDPESEAAVTQVELLFDLVFVFAVTQLSHLLLSHLTWSGAVDTGLLFAAVWWAWISTGWATNWLDPEQRPVRILLFALMAAGLVMSAALPRAFGNRGLVFAVSFSALQLGRCSFMLWALKAHNPAKFRNFQRILVWGSLVCLLWLFGAFRQGWDRLLIWAAAVALETFAPAVGFWTPGLGRSATTDWDVNGRHMAERCSAFVLIALGESLTVTGAAFFQTHWDPAVAAAFGCAFLGAVALWWIYFDTAAERTTQTMAEADDPGRLARSSYTYLHMVLVAGVIVWAVADQQVMILPLAPADPATVGVLLGGPAIYMVGNAVFRRTMSPRLPPSHIVGVALLTVTAAQWAVWGGPKLLFGGEAALILTLTGAIGSILFARQERRRSPCA